MKVRRYFGFLCRAMLRTAAVVVPRSERDEWLTEWTSECWYFSRDRASAMKSPPRLSMARFCLGSFRDAFWLRCNHSGRSRADRFRFRSPTTCAAILTALGALALAAARFESVLQPPYTGRSFILGQLLVLGVALLLVRISTPFELGGYPTSTYPRLRGARLQWSVFLGIKILLILLIVFCGTLDLGPIIASAGIRPHATLVGYVLGLRWALIDQSRRCPVCLRLLTNPVRIGDASHMMLELYGTELVCLKGHGLLHVPEVPRSSYRAQQWLALDGSWQELFS